MSRFELRPYQEQFVKATLEKFRDHSKLLGVAATGSGKTVMFSNIAELVSPVRTLILAHREELLTQAQDKLFRSTGLAAQIEKAEQRASHQANVVVASVQTLMGDKRLQRWPRDHFGLVVVDEAHHVLADSYQKVLSHFDPYAKVLGVTATPDRGDKRSLGEYFEDISYEIGLHELIKQNYLSPIVVRTMPVQINLGGVRTTAGDYNDADLGNAIEPFLESIVGALGAAIGNRKTLVFLPLVRTSKLFVDLCHRAGLTAEHIDGTSSNRKEILDAYGRGEFQILCNSMLLTEGFDEPSVSCVICLRPTKIRALYSQIIGRGTRIHPGKENLLVLDFLWMTEKHSLVRPAHLVAPSEEIAQQMVAMAEEAAAEDLEQDLMDMVTDAKEARERKLAAELDANAQRKSKLIDPIEFALSLHEVDLADWEPTMRWHRDPPSDGQLRALKQFGFDPATVSSKGYASVILDRIFSRRDLKLASPKQLHWLRKTGHPQPDLATFAEAKAWLDQQFNRRAG